MELKMADEVAVCASHDALGNLSLGLRDALGETHVSVFGAVDVIKLKGSVVPTVSAIYTPMGQFVCPQEVIDPLSAGTGLPIEGVPVPRKAQSVLTPILAFCWIVLTVARLTVGLTHVLGVSLSPPPVCLAGGFWMPLAIAAGIFSASDALVLCPHVVSIAQVPCKPDIFEATYEPAKG